MRYSSSAPFVSFPVQPSMVPLSSGRTVCLQTTPAGISVQSSSIKLHTHCIPEDGWSPREVSARELDAAGVAAAEVLFDPRTSSASHRYSVQ
jgi:hypothetical protein